MQHLQKNPFSLPWNQNTPIGYLCEACVVFCTGCAYIIVNGSILILFFSICLHHRAFYQMIHHNLQNFNRCDEMKRDNEEFLCKLIRFHISIKE